MAIKNNDFGGTDYIDGDVLPAVDLLDTNTYMGYTPVGSITSWLKTFTSQSSGTATTDTVDKLVDTGATFQTDGVTAGMIIHNTTDDTFGIVSSVDSETQITIAADSQAGSSTTDVFPDGNETYVIYATSKLEEGWVECNGQTLSDADSPYNGTTIPDLNGSNYLLKGDSSSGTTGAEDYLPPHTHNQGTLKFSVTSQTGAQGFGSGLSYTGNISGNTGSTTSGTAMVTYTVVMILRVK